MGAVGGVAAIGLLLAGCGGSGRSGGAVAAPTPATFTQASLQSAAQSYVDAVLGGHVSAAAAWLAEDCTDQADKSGLAAAVAAVSSLAHGARMTVDSVKLFDPDSGGVATFHLSAGASAELNQQVTQTLVEDGSDYHEWRFANGSWAFRASSCSTAKD